ncbi:MAG TPA: glycerol-3-phosphate dehydrogenase/oxidase [Fulvivirga sp.]|nr:glycerol-3-phosphate dehydrogenase/oxidase [Fulvivirga sp.]
MDDSLLDRSTLLHSLKTESFDLIVIGGGITGAGIALDASSRGLKTLLVEKNDFASGTSSRSTKLIHGGLRYLKQFEIGLVHQVGRERAIVHKLAPHLVRAEKMLLPFKKGGNFGRMLTSIGLKIYDLLAGVDEKDKRVILSKKQALTHEPLLDPNSLKGAGLYAEYRTDDARLTIEVIKTATSKYGAKCINYLEVTDLTYNEGKVNGINAKDNISGQHIQIKGKILINASGPWVDELRTKDKSLTDKRLHLTKGIHIVVDYEKFPIQQALYFDVTDGRMIFAIPRGKITYIGTTDTDYFGSKEEITIEQKDVDYLLTAVNEAFPNIQLSSKDVQSAWAGLRPLIHEEGKSPSELSRKDEVFMSETGLISIAGGKLTGYRRMAMKIIDTAIKKNRNSLNGVNLKKCFTRQIALVGGPFKSAAEVESYTMEVAKKLSNLEEHYPSYLVSNYGRQTDEIIEQMDLSIAPQLSLLLSEIKFCIKNEWIIWPTDFFVRRSGMLYFDIQQMIKYKDNVLHEFSSQFNWSEKELTQAKISLERSISIATIYP